MTHHTSTPTIDSRRGEVYSPDAVGRFRLVDVRNRGGDFEAAIWAHDGTAWVTMTGCLTSHAARHLCQVLRSDFAEDVEAVLNLSGLTRADAPVRDQVRWVSVELAVRGLSVCLVDTESAHLDDQGRSLAVAGATRHR